MNHAIERPLYTQNACIWQPPLTTPFEQTTWQSPQNDTVFFCDLHANADAFLRSLKASCLVSQTSQIEQIQLTTQGLCTKIVIGGDCFDKGPSHLELFELLAQLRQQGAHLVLLAGNHDIRVYAGLMALAFQDDPKQSHFFTRMGRKTSSLLAEIFQQYFVKENLTPANLPRLSDEQIKQALFPNKNWPKLFTEQAKAHLSSAQIAKEIQQIAFKQADFLAACQELGLTLAQLYWAVQKAHDLWIKPQGAYHWFFKDLQLMHREGSYLFCHAGLDDQMAQWMQTHCVEQLNRHFQQQLRQGALFEIYYSEFGNVFRTKYRLTDRPLTDKGVQSLKKLGIYALVNGHRSHENGQQLLNRNGLIHFECDTQLNRNCRTKSQNTQFSATVFYHSGAVSAICSDAPLTKIFNPRHLLPPRKVALQKKLSLS